MTILYTIGPLKEVNMVLFLRNKRFNFMLFWGGGDYQLRSALAAKQIWVGVITIWGTLDSLPTCTQFGKFTPFFVYYCWKRSLHQMCSFYSLSPVNCGSKNIKINKSMKFWNNVQCAWPLIFQQNCYYLFFYYFRVRLG